MNEVMTIKQTPERKLVTDVKTKILNSELELVQEIADAGFYISVAYGFSGPSTNFIFFPDEWVREYTEFSYSLSDPLFVWALSNTGIVRWSDIDLPDPNNIKDKMKAHGLLNGASASVVIEGKRSIGLYAKKEGELSDTDLRVLYGSLERLQLSLHPDINLSKLELETLKLFADGTSLKGIARLFQVSDQLIIRRMHSVRAKFGTSTNVEAVAMAIRLGVIE